MVPLHYSLHRFHYAGIFFFGGGGGNLVSFAAIFWDVTQRSPQRNGCSHLNNIPFPKWANHNFRSISFFIFTLHGGHKSTRRQWLSLRFTETLWLNARQPGMFLNRLNARQSNKFTEFSLNASKWFFSPYMYDKVWCLANKQVIIHIVAVDVYVKHRFYNLNYGYSSRK